MQEYLDYICKYCQAEGLTIAVAESVTAGYLQVHFSRASGATGFFQGGITAYNVGQKVKHLGVEPIHAQAVNAVSPEVAAEMALGVCTLFNCNAGIAVTGYAAPVPELNITDLFAYYAIACKGRIIASGKIIPSAGHPEEVMQEYAREIIYTCYGRFKEYRFSTLNGGATKNG
ncbi:CinA family protein [uncultured Chitinophaga sp.]|jgi:competence/damage-inducible protein CinA C-terminal domain|uniref:CinA family protein n=1 Tax=uncultured Chitinophaga sp. TaxID=339340 RepID=UPI0026153884|nr:CinA family protein [uncultured Chitinophaga sp.]